MTLRWEGHDVGPALDMKLLASHRAPSRAQRRRAAVRAVFFGLLVVLAVVAAYGFMWATIVIAVDHRRFVWPWIGATFTAAGLIFLVCWLVERRPDRGAW